MEREMELDGCFGHRVGEIADETYKSKVGGESGSLALRFAVVCVWRPLSSNSFRVCQVTAIPVLPAFSAVCRWLPFFSSQ
jgi:hypothetical protein